MGSVGVRIVSLAPMRVARFRATGKEPEHVAMGYMKRWLLGQRLRHPEAVRLFGFDVEVTKDEQKRGFRGYEAWANVPDRVRPGRGVGIRHAPGGLYAVLRVPEALVDPYARIPSSWQHLWKWVKESREYRLTDGLCFEEEIAKGGSLHLDLFMPVARAGRAQPRRRPLPR